MVFRYRPSMQPNMPFNISDDLWDNILIWFYGKMISLGWTFVSAMASYSPFLLMTLIENKLDEHKWKKIQQMQLRAREDYAMEELSAYKDGDDQDQYLKPIKKKSKKGKKVETEEKKE